MKKEGEMDEKRYPRLTVDAIIEYKGGIVLVRRKNPPHGWALPGGFVEYGETVEQAVLREAEEETGLKIKEIKQFRVYSDPNRDPRGHTVTVVFVGSGEGELKASTDAEDVKVFKRNELPPDIVFDHRKILEDYFGEEYTEEHAKKGLDEPLPLIKCFPNQFREIDYKITIEIPEYTSVCPKTGFPDYGKITIEYIPGEYCVELKSMKFYILGYRNLGIFYENAVNRILEDFVKAVKPKWVKIKGEFNPRGGMYTKVEREYRKK